MRVSNCVRAVSVTGLLAIGSMAAFGNVIGPGDCAGSLCGSTLTNFTNFPIGDRLAETNVRFFAPDPEPTPVYRYGGQLRSAVYRNAGGTLDFYFQFQSASSVAFDDIDRLTMTNFSGFTTDVGYRTDNWDGSAGSFAASTQNPWGVERSAGGGTLGFYFGPLAADKINPGDVSATMVIRTNATNWTNGILAVTHSTAPYQMTDAFAPAAEVSGVPEPGTYALIGAGLMAIAAVRRRK